jgi:hypothetical protein
MEENKNNSNTNIEGTTQKEVTSNIESKALTMEEVQKLIQSETDKIRTEYSKKLKTTEKEKEDLLKTKMTDDEKVKFELEKLQKELSEKEKSILAKELTIKTIDLLKENDLPLDFKDFVLADSEENTINKIKKFKEIWNKAIANTVDDKFKDNGRKPNESPKAKDELAQLQEQYNDCMKKGDHQSILQAFAIKEKISKLKK